ncbi:MAG TPA: hypothetical protein VLH60_01570 [Sedimentisphaerales bacterium]|nr:hypothetical protein [Sedimentisphaerales bacterium]
MGETKNRHSGQRRLLALIGVAVCVAVCTSVVCGRDAAPQGPGASPPPPPQQPPSPQQAQAHSVHIVTQAAVRMGVLSCVSRINQVATVLTAGTQSGVFIFDPHPQAPDQHIFSTSFEMVRPDNTVFYASASFFPNQNAVYNTVEYVNMPIEQVEKTIFTNLRRIGIVKNNIVLLDGGAVKVFLMPAGSGTVVIKKEVIR